MDQKLLDDIAKKTFHDPTATADTPASVSPEMTERIGALRSQVQETFGKVVMTLMMIPRYRHQTLGDLQHLVLEPLIRDRIAMA